MPTIKIKNFLIIKDAEFDIKKINVIIGEQATGKSVIAKLVYFFNRFFSEAFIGASEYKKTKEDIKKEILSKFKEIFPHYSWHNQEFSIAYHTDIYEVKLINKKTDDKYDFNVEYSEELEKLYEELRILNEELKMSITMSKEHIANSNDKLYILLNKSLEDDDESIDYFLLIEEQRKKEKQRKKIAKKEIEFVNNFKKDSIFIPTARSFFIILGNNIFSLLENDINLDIFMKGFGSLWESAKSHYQFNIIETYMDNIIEESKKLNNELNNKDLQFNLLNPSIIIRNITQQILRGKYLRDNNEDYIEHHDGSKIKLKDASSGQQEALPMLIILLNLLIYDRNETKSTMVFIEEPEAHLFPKSQKAMISLIATIANARDCPFVLTTHSPYILSAINNLIVGADAFEKIKDNPDKVAELEDFIPQSEMVRFEEVSAYTIEDGKLISIMNDDNRLIDANIIDDVSNEFADAFDKACEFIYRDK